MLKRKSIYFVSVLIAIVYLTLTFISCSEDNPVIPPDNYGFDSARFSWTRDTVWPGQYDYALWVADTSNVFLIDAYSNTLLKLNNRNKTFYTFPNYTLISVLLGPDLNNGYMFGTDVTEGNTKFLVWKYVGNEFLKIQEIPISFATRLHTGYYVSPTEMWLAGWGGFVAKYDGSSITQYQLPDSLLFTDIFADRQNNIKLIALGEEPNFPSHPILMNFIFEYDQINKKWGFIFRDTAGSSNYGFRLMVLDRDIIGVKDKGIYSFNGQTFHEVINFGNNVIGISRIDGLSLTNYMISCCILIGNPSSGLAHWNGSKLSNENIQLCTSTSIIKMYNDRFCAFVRAGNGTEIYIGKKK